MPRGGKRRGRAKEKEFMDAVLDAFVRDEALRLWRSAEGIAGAARLEPEAALKEAGGFLEKAPYHDIWRRWWRDRALPDAAADEGTRFAAVEDAIRGAVLEERRTRTEMDDAPLEETSGYQAFVRRAMDQLLTEAAGEIEEEV